MAAALAASYSWARSRSRGPVGGWDDVPQVDRAFVLACRLGVGVDGAEASPAAIATPRAPARVLRRPSSDGRARRAGWPAAAPPPAGEPRSPGRTPRGGTRRSAAAARRRPPPGPARGGTGSARLVGARAARGSAPRRLRGGRPDRAVSSRARNLAEHARGPPGGRRPRRLDEHVLAVSTRQTSRTAQHARGASSGSRSASPDRPTDGDELLGEERVAVRPSGDRVESVAAGGAPRIAVSSSLELRALETARSIRSTRGQPLHLGEPRPQRVAPVQLVGPVGRDDGIRSSRALRARNARRSRVERSAQCRSSMTSRTGAVSPSRPSSLRRPSKMRVWAQSGRAGGVVVEPSRPQLRDEPGELGRTRAPAAPRRRRSTSRTRARSAAAIGPNGSPSSPRRRTRPRGRASRARDAGAASSARSRVLPMPASPPIRTNRRLPRTRPRRPSRGACRAHSSGRRRPGWTGAEPCSR